MLEFILIILDCESSSTSGQGNIHTNGCLKELSKDSVGQTIGLAVINSFLVVILMAAILEFLETDSNEIS